MKLLQNGKWGELRGDRGETSIGLYVYRYKYRWKYAVHRDIPTQEGGFTQVISAYDTYWSRLCRHAGAEIEKTRPAALRFIKLVIYEIWDIWDCNSQR